MPNSPLASPSATVAVLQRCGLFTRKSLGQHFLVDDNVVGRILTLAGLSGTETVLEIGPGIGTLTAALCRAAGEVVAVEKDAALLAPLAEVQAQCGNVRVVAADALDLPMDELTGDAGPPVALVANLPYAVAATVVLRAFETMPSLRSATVMVQAEVAARMAADPGGKDYGAYTVKLRLHAEPAGRFAVARGCFLPPPRVDSTVLRLDRVERGLAPEELRRAAALADAAFGQRRKTLRNSLAAGLAAPPAQVADLLAWEGVDPRRRAETLTVDDYVRLSRVLAGYGLLP